MIKMKHKETGQEIQVNVDDPAHVFIGRWKQRGFEIVEGAKSATADQPIPVTIKKKGGAK